MIPPIAALCAWIPISLFLFWRYPVRIAILLSYLGGWALLPSAAFVTSAAPFPYWILGTCLPSSYVVTKASVLGVASLCGLLLFDPRGLLLFRASLWDLPMAVWCVVPLLSGIANGLNIRMGLRMALYQTIAWGVPYLLGRTYFTDSRSLVLAARGFVIAGTSYVPICLVEIYMGPHLYAWLYGYEPYRWIGAVRYVGFRPIGLLEDGNQLGIWMATAALIAVWLWRRGVVREVLGISIGWVSGGLVVVNLLCQSGGSLILLAVLLPFLLLRQRHGMRILVVLILGAIFALTSFRLANVVSLRSLVKSNAVASEGAQFLRRIGRGSFGWRLAQDEKHVGLALEHPILGSGAWDWWRSTASRPWGLWLLAFGMYGAVGLTALQCLQLIPVARLALRPARSEMDGLDLHRLVSVVILMSAIDNLLNGSMILPLVLLIGGVSGDGLSGPGVAESADRKDSLGRASEPPGAVSLRGRLV